MANTWIFSILTSLWKNHFVIWIVHVWFYFT